MPADQLAESPLGGGGRAATGVEPLEQLPVGNPGACAPGLPSVWTRLGGTSANLFVISTALRRFSLYCKLPGAGRLLTTFLGNSPPLKGMSFLRSFS